MSCPCYDVHDCPVYIRAHDGERQPPVTTQSKERGPSGRGTHVAASLWNKLPPNSRDDHEPQDSSGRVSGPMA